MEKKEKDITEFFRLDAANALVKDYNDGFSYGELAKIHNVSKSTIHHMITKISTKTARRGPVHSKNITQENLQDLMTNSKDFPKCYWMKKLDVGYKRLRALSKTYNLQFKDRYPKVDQKKLMDLYNVGYSLTDIGKTLGVSDVTVRNYLIKLGISTKKMRW